MAIEIFGYEFKNETLLAEALTTPAYRNEHAQVKDNQRLEFLGDAVLCLLGAEWVYRNRPKDNEGQMTERRAHMVSTAALCAAADRLGLRARVRYGANTEPPKSAKLFADAIEAVIGAAYLDGGLEAAKQVFKVLELSAYAEGHAWSVNPKGELQILSQKMVPPRLPEYTIVKVEGKAHDPTFTVRVAVEGLGEAEGVARTHKEAESIAALGLLSRLEELKML